MKAIEFLEMLTKYAKDYSLIAGESVKRNSHMNNVDEGETVNKEISDAVLVDFINYIGMKHCVDYALYTKDLRKRD